jgi:PIN domain nuclease of toxin-antitoxin system
VKLLLDTCTFLWLTLDAKELSEAARNAFASPESEVFLSAVSAWEIAVKYRLGRLRLPVLPREFVPSERSRHGIEALGLTEAAALTLERLPDLHRDPFDRMLVSQAIVGGMSLVTPDPLIQQYPVMTLW